MSTKQTTMKHLAGADWKQLENDVVTRIRLLRSLSIAAHKDAAPLNDNIANDLILPNLKLLASFCASVSVGAAKRKVVIQREPKPFALQILNRLLEVGIVGRHWEQSILDIIEEESTATCSSCGMPCCAACSYHHGLKVHLCQTCDEKSLNPPLMADGRKPQFNPGIPDESPPDEG